MALTKPSPWKTVDERLREREEKREAVLRAAALAFSERGFHNTALEDVARDLKVTKPTVYYYGESKEALLIACYRRAIQTLDDVTLASGPTTVSDRANVRLRVLIVAYAEAILSIYGRCLTRVPDTSVSPEIRTELRALKRTVDDRFRAVLAAGCEDGSLIETDVKMAAFAISGALNAAALWFEDGGAMTAREIGERYAEFFVRALEAR